MEGTGPRVSHQAHSRCREGSQYLWRTISYLFLLKGVPEPLVGRRIGAMSKFKLTFKLAGLEIEVEGDREYAPQIAENIGRQLSQIMQPAALIDPQGDPPTAGVIEGKSTDQPRRTGRRRRVAARATGSSQQADSSGIPGWEHNPQKWGTPNQDWKSPQKIAWMLLVMEKASGKRAELTSTQVADAFNAKFKSAGLIRRGNVARDLGNSSDLFGEMEGRWFLKEKGTQAAEKLIAEAVGAAETA